MQELKTLDCAKQTATFFCDPCNVQKEGRVRGVIFVEKTQPIEDIDAQNWFFWKSLIEQKKAFLIPNTRGDYSSEGQTGDGFGDQEQKVIGRNHTANVMFQNVSNQNQLFLDFLNRATEYRLVMIGANELYVARASAQTNGGLVIEQSTQSENHYNLAINWSQLEQVRIIEDAPVNQLLRCYTLEGSEASPDCCLNPELNDFAVKFNYSSSFPNTGGWEEDGDPTTDPFVDYNGSFSIFAPCCGNLEQDLEVFIYDPENPTTQPSSWKQIQLFDINISDNTVSLSIRVNQNSPAEGLAIRFRACGFSQIYSPQIPLPANQAEPCDSQPGVIAVNIPPANVTQTPQPDGTIDYEAQLNIQAICCNDNILATEATLSPQGAFTFRNGSQNIPAGSATHTLQWNIDPTQMPSGEETVEFSFVTNSCGNWPALVDLQLDAPAAISVDPDSNQVTFTEGSPQVLNVTLDLIRTNCNEQINLTDTANSNLPANLIPTITPASALPGTNQATLELNYDGSATAGNYWIEIEGVASCDTDAATIVVVIQP
jgi:hypothetical protein